MERRIQDIDKIDNIELIEKVGKRKSATPVVFALIVVVLAVVGGFIIKAQFDSLFSYVGDHVQREPLTIVIPQGAIADVAYINAIPRGENIMHWFDMIIPEELAYLSDFMNEKRLVIKPGSYYIPGHVLKEDFLLDYFEFNRG